MYCFVLFFCFFFWGGGVALKFLKELSTLSVCFFPGLGKRKTNARPGPVFPHVPPLHDNGWMRGGGGGGVGGGGGGGIGTEVCDNVLFMVRWV